MSPTSTPTANLSPANPLLATLPEGEPALSLGFAAAHWTHTNLLQPNGPRARKPFRLTRDQFRFLLWWYALDGDGRWLFQHGARRLAKGSGKSPFAAVLALLEFLGPVRLLDFDPKAPGGVVGQPVDMPLVQIAATAESQTANTMRMVRAFAPKRGPLVERYNLDAGKTQYYKIPEGTLEVITSSATAAEGAEATFIVADETEHWKPSNGGPELMATLADNLAKSGSRMIETSNAWVPAAESVAQATYDDWLAQQTGEFSDGGLVLYDARMAPPDTNFADPDSLRRALEWVYGDCDWKKPNYRNWDPKTGPMQGVPDVESIMGRIYRKSAKPDDSKRKYANWPTAALDAWTTEEEWNRLADPNLAPLVDGDEVVMFFDGSKSRDHTALIACRLSDGAVFTLGIWQPQSATDRETATVDVFAVDRKVAEAFERYDVLAYWADVREWESFALTTWPQAYGDRVIVKAAPSARPAQPIAWDMRGHVYEFAKATEAVLEEIIGQEFAHDGDLMLAAHVANARRRDIRGATGIGKESKDSPRKIDGAVAMIGARMLRRVVLSSPEYAKRRKTAGRFRRIR